MKKVLMTLASGLLAASSAFGADILTTATAPATSACPAVAVGVCSSGWFVINGAASVAVKVNADAGTNTVVLDHRMDATDTAVSTLYTWTNAGATTVGRVIYPPVGEVRVRVTAIGGGGTVTAKLTATTPGGVRLW